MSKIYNNDNANLTIKRKTILAEKLQVVARVSYNHEDSKQDVHGPYRLPETVPKQYTNFFKATIKPSCWFKEIRGQRALTVT